MNKFLKSGFLAAVVLSALCPAAMAQDAPPPTASISVKAEAKLDRAKDKRNFVLYFTLLQLQRMDVSFANQTRFHFEKFVEKGAVKKGKKYLKADEAAKAKCDLALDLKVEVKYVELKMKMDGKEVQTGHKWQGTVTGTFKDAAGAEIKKIKIRHSWGTNMTVSRKKGVSIFMSQLSNWLILDIGSTKQFRAVVPEAKHADLDKTLKNYKEQKKKIYDDTWK